MKKKVFFLFVFLLCTRVFGGVKDSSFVGKSNIPTLQFPGALPVPGRILEVSPVEAPEEYVVEYGDTLYDICEQLLGEASYWPKLWALNTYIENPHFIWPGMRLHFYSGDAKSPPFLQIVTDKSIEPGVKPLLTLNDMPIHKWDPLAIIKNKMGKITDLSELPTTEYDIIDAGETYQLDRVIIDIPGFIYHKEPKALGTVLSGTSEEMLAVVGQSVFYYSEGKLQAGDVYSVVRKIRNYSETKGQNLILYSYIADIKIASSNQDGKQPKKQYADIIYGDKPIEAGDIFIPYRLVKKTIFFNKLDMTKLSSKVSIISFGDFEKNYGGEGSLVFMNGGSKQGVFEGQKLRILLGNNSEFSLHTFASGAIGELQVISVTEGGAVGLILKSKHEVVIGDIVGNG